MPRPRREPQITVAIRLAPDGLRKVDELAEREDRSRSDMIRRMLAYAAQHMPPGWRPAERKDWHA